MNASRRIIIVRRAAADVYDHLQRQFAGDPETIVIYDRRSESRRRAQRGRKGAPEKRRGERRLPHNFEILDIRGFYSIRSRRPGKRRPATSLDAKD